MFKPLLLAGLFLIGCAHSKQAKRGPSEEGDLEPGYARSAPKARPGASSVKLITKEPPKERWELAGKITGESASDDTVEAAVTAENDLKNKAALLGASLVKIDQVSPPGDKGRRGKQVVFMARAYRERPPETD